MELNRCWWVLLLASTFLFGLTGQAQADDKRVSRRDDALEKQFEADLEAIAPEAVPDFRRGNELREQDDAAGAIAAYDAVLARAPEFDHALRRRCSVRQVQGEGRAGLADCRKALELNHSQWNIAGVASALAGLEDPSSAEVEEAANLADEVLALGDEAHVDSIASACQAYMASGDVSNLELCQRKIIERDDTHPLGYLYGWMAAVARGDVDGAESWITRAEAAGVDPEFVGMMRGAMDEMVQPVWWLRVLIWIGYALVAWLVGFGVLILLGMFLGHRVLRSAERMTEEVHGRGDAGHSRLRRIYKVVLGALCVSYYLSLPLMLIIVVLAGVGIVGGIFIAGFVSIKLTLIVGIFVFVSVGAVLRSLFIRVDDSDPGEELDVSEYPQLGELLTEVAQAVGTRSVDKVFLTPTAEVAVYERGGFMRQVRGQGERCLILGLAALEGMDIGSLKSILAHEYGHFSNRDTAGGGLALRVRASMVKLIQGLAEGGAAAWYNPAWLFAIGFYKLFLRISQGASRLQEILADRWAVRAYGAEPFERGLRHVMEKSIRFETNANRRIGEIANHGGWMRNLYTELPSDPIADDEVSRELEESLEADPSPFDSHPRPVDRFRWAAALGVDVEEAPEDREPAWGLIGELEALQLRMTNAIRMNIAAGTGLQIPAAPPNE